MSRFSAPSGGLGGEGLMRKKLNLIIKFIKEKTALEETTQKKKKKYKDKQTTLISEVLSSTKGIAFEGELKD